MCVCILSTSNFCAKVNSSKHALAVNLVSYEIPRCADSLFDVQVVKTLQIIRLC